MAFIIKPLVTEKMTKITEKRPNRYGFIVRPEANKIEIQKEIEATYNVTVEDVNTMRYAGKAIAGTIFRLYDDPSLLEAARKEFLEKTEGGYVSLIPPDLKPPLPPREEWPEEYR